MSPAFSRLAGTNVTNSTLPKQWGPWDSVSFSLMHVFVWLWCGKRKEAVGSHLRKLEFRKLEFRKLELSIT